MLRTWNRHAFCHVLGLFRAIVEVAAGDGREAQHRCKCVQSAARDEAFSGGMLLLLMLLDVQEGGSEVGTVSQSIAVRRVCQVEHGELEREFFQRALVTHRMRMVTVTRAHRWRWRRRQETVTKVENRRHFHFSDEGWLELVSSARYANNTPGKPKWTRILCEANRSLKYTTKFICFI